MSMLTNNVELYKKKAYVAYNATFGTAIAINTDPGAISATEGMLSIYNSASRTSGTENNTLIIPKYIKLVTVVVGASGTNFKIRLAQDVIKRWSSGGSALTTNQTYADTTTGFTRRTPKATIYFGDLTLAAASSEVQVGQVTFHSATAAQIAGDQYMIVFGDTQFGTSLVSATAAGTYTQSVSEVILGPGCSLIAQPWEASAATTAATFEVEIGYYEVKF